MYDLEQLKSRAAQCLTDVGDDGPAAQRFCAELTRLLYEIEASEATSLSGQTEIKQLENQLDCRKKEVEQASIDLQASCEKVSVLGDEIDSNNASSKQIEETTEAMKSQVRRCVNKKEMPHYESLRFSSLSRARLRKWFQKMKRCKPL